MIFKQWRQVLRLEDPPKWQTRRVKKPGEELILPLEQYRGVEGVVLFSFQSGKPPRVKHYVGQTVAVVPKRGQPAIWLGPKGQIMDDADALQEQISGEPLDGFWHTWRDLKQYLQECGWREGRVKIIALREEPLHAISAADAVAEGVADVDTYRALWQSINGGVRGADWADNPTVIVYTLEPLP